MPLRRRPKSSVACARRDSFERLDGFASACRIIAVNCRNASAVTAASSASRTLACAEKGSELHNAVSETFDLVLEALEAPAIGYLRERHALKIWAALHGVVMLAEQGLLTGEVAHTTREELVEDFVNETRLALDAAIKDVRRNGEAEA